MKKTFLFLTVLFLTSCGVRKVNKSVTSEKATIVITDTSKVKTIDKTITNTLEVVTNDEITIEPIDTLQPMVINGKTYKNARLKHRKQKSNTITVIKNNVAKIEQKAIFVNAVNEKKTDVKNTDRKASYWWLLWFLLIIPAVYVWKKYSWIV